MNRKRLFLISFIACSSILASCGGRSSQEEPLKFQCEALELEDPVDFILDASLPRLDVYLTSAPRSPLVFSRYDLMAGMSYSYGFNIFDLDCDGKQDISFFDSFSGRLTPTRNHTGVDGYLKWNDGPIESIVLSDLYSEVPGASSINVTLFERHISMDINHDGLPDIVGVANSHRAVVAYLNPGLRDQAWSKRYLSMETDGPINIDQGDLDGDGDADIVVALRLQTTTNPDAAHGGVVWLENPGAHNPHGEWRLHWISGSDDLVNPRTLRVADIDADGQPDIVVSDAESGRVRWFKNINSAADWEMFEVPEITTAFGHFGTTADLDGDGLIDIIQPVYRGIRWMRNIDGQNQWESIPIASFEQDGEPLTVSEVAIGDLDSDNKTDVVFAVASFSNDTYVARRGGIYWLRQGAAQWELFKIQDEESAVVGVSLVDYNSDGHLDIVSNSEYQRNGVTLWINSLGTR